MDKYFRNKYRIPSTRLRYWDYSNQGIYFITICTKGREHYFGKITTCIELSEIGKIAYSEWYKTLELRPDMNLQLGEFIVMPNHVHGIIIIGGNEYNDTPCRGAMHGVSGDNCNSLHFRDAMHRVSIAGFGESKNHFAPQSKNLASIIRVYKSAVTMAARKFNIEFEWQPRYHDSIIRSYREFNIVSKYIKNNPNNWNNDMFIKQ